VTITLEFLEFLFWGMVIIYNNEFKTKGNKVLIKGKIEPQHIYCMYCGHGSNLSCFPFPLAVGEETFRLFSVTATTYILWTSKLDSSLDLSIQLAKVREHKFTNFVVMEDSWKLNVSLLLHEQ